MIEVELDHKRKNQFIYNGHYSVRTYSIVERKAYYLHKRGLLPTPELTEWLLDNVGEHINTFRHFDRFTFNADTWRNGEPVEEWEDISWEEWNHINKFVPAEKRCWTVTADANLAFKTLEQAALFKLRWF